MIIRCPHCEHTRSISEGKIPAQAEYATCPKCRHRFLFRSLPRDVEAKAPPSSAAASAAAVQARKHSGEDRHPPQPRVAGPEVLRPQEPFRESEEQRDIWDAMDALHQRWEAQLDQHVTEVEQPRPAKAGEAAETFFPPDSPAGGPEAARAAPDQAAPLSRERAALQASPPPSVQASGQIPDQIPGQPSGQIPGQPPGQPSGQAPSQAPLTQAAAPEADPALPQRPSQAPSQPASRSLGQPSAQASAQPSPPQAQPSEPGSRAGERRRVEDGSSRSPDPGADPDHKNAGSGPTTAGNSAGDVTGGSSGSSSEKGVDNSAGGGGTGSVFSPAARSDSGPAPGPDSGPDVPRPDSAPVAAPVSAAVVAPPSEQAARPRFPVYGEDGPDPEERVEKDLAMLRAASASGPMRDLGRLREFPEPGQPSEDGAAAEDGDLLHLPGPEADPAKGQAVETRTPAWEHPSGSRLAAFNATVRGVMFGGPGYFSGMSGNGSLVPGYLFFLLMGYICILCSLAWRGLAELLLPGLLPPFPRGLVLPALLLLAPAALGLMQLFVTGWIRLLLRLLVPDQADFGLVYKVVSYSVAPFVLSVVPFAGPLLGAAWFMASLTSGCRGALRLSLPLSILLPLPPALLLLTALAWYFL